MEGNTPHYMRGYWEQVRDDAERLLETANRELGKIALKESNPQLEIPFLSLNGDDDRTIDGYIYE